MIVLPQVFGDKAPNKEDKQKEQNEFFERLLPSLNALLKDKSFFCGKEMTVADLQYYNELVTLLSLIKINIDEKTLPNLY